MRLLLSLCMVVFLPLSAFSNVYFFSDGGTFATLQVKGRSIKYQLSYSSGGQPTLDQAHLGVFSKADGDTLYLTGFENNTVEDMFTSIFVGKFAHRVYAAGQTPGIFNTNFATLYVDLGDWKECHYETNLHINLLDQLAPGEYRLEAYALAGGNFSPDLEQNNNGSNYIARFTVTDQPLPIPPEATPDAKMRVNFEYTVDAGYGNEVFVVGNHPDLGNWNPLLGRKLFWTSGNRWTGQVAVTENTSLEYKYIIRTNQNADFAKAENVVWMPGPNLRTNTAALPGRPYVGKTLYYYSTWTSATLVYQCDPDTNWYARAMEVIGAGRSSGESLYRVSGFGKAGETLTFVPSGYLNNTQYWDHTPIPGQENYYTRLDAALLRDGNMYNYWPPTNAPVSRIETTFITSAWQPTISSRTVRIYLPRYYDQNTAKRYPVLYLHDGQNDFRPGGAFGCWYAEDAADHMISLGLMREAIIVAVDNTGSRMREYVPPSDDAGGGNGFADLYVKFLAQNVKPYIDSNYRTLIDADNTAVAGSSLGGLVSMYAGLTTNVFSKLGGFSSSFWAGTNFVNQYIIDGATKGRRIYLDCGTLESNLGMWRPMWEVYNYLLIDGYAANDDLSIRGGINQDHNEAAWAARCPEAFAYLLSIRDEGNLLAAQQAPPELTMVSTNSTQTGLRFVALKGLPYRLQVSTSLASSAWTSVQTNSFNQMMWQSATISNISRSGDLNLYRLAISP
jgi:predicted alpha/beta superfamily hydrolase